MDVSEVYKRLVKELGMSHEQANFVIGLMEQTNSTLDDALHEINNYINKWQFKKEMLNKSLL